MTKVLLLYDEISPASAKTFVSEITKLSPTADVTIAINSPGGSVPAGDAIAAAIDRHRGKTTARIDGVAASAASYIAMFCDRIIMARGSFLMLHEPYATMVGGAAELENAARTLRTISARYATAYAARCGQDEAKVRGWMAAETWFDAAQAVEAGVCDEIDTALSRAKAVSAAVLKFQRVPMEVRAMAGAGRKPNTRTPEQRARLRRRLEIIAMQARFAGGRDPKRDEEDRARGERQRRRYEMKDIVEAIKADDRAAEAAERAAIKERQRQAYYGMPRGQR